MGREPLEKDIPIEADDLPLQVQQALLVYSVLPDKIEGMNGVWLGKDFAGLKDIFSIYGITDKREVFDYLVHIIKICEKHYESQRRLKLK